MFPSCEGRFVILALPSSVSMIAPFTKMFCLARNTFDGVSVTFLIADFLALPFIITFAMFPRNETNFWVFPLPLRSFVFVSPIFTILVWFCLPVNFLFFGFLYRPPEAFLPDFIIEKEIFGLSRFRWVVVLGLILCELRIVDCVFVFCLVCFDMQVLKGLGFVVVSKLICVFGCCLFRMVFCLYIWLKIWLYFLVVLLLFGIFLRCLMAIFYGVFV
jgi:hypothetical protein